MSSFICIRRQMYSVMLSNQMSEEAATLDAAVIRFRCSYLRIIHENIFQQRSIYTTAGK